MNASNKATTGYTMNATFIRARVSLLGHTALGVVRLRYIDGGGIELSDGRRYGPGAIFSIEPLPPEMVPTEAEIQQFQTAFGEDTMIKQDTRGRWSVLLPDGSEWTTNSILEAVAGAIGLILDAKNADILALRERLSEAESGDSARAALLLEALTRLEPSEKSAVLRRSPTYGPTMPGDWSLSINYQPDAVKGSLDDVVAYILDDLGKPAPIDVETPTETPPAAPEVEPTVEDYDAPF